MLRDSGADVDYLPPLARCMSFRHAYRVFERWERSLHNGYRDIAGTRRQAERSLHRSRLRLKIGRRLSSRSRRGFRSRRRAVCTSPATPRTDPSIPRFEAGRQSRDHSGQPPPSSAPQALASQSGRNASRIVRRCCRESPQKTDQGSHLDRTRSGSTRDKSRSAAIRAVMCRGASL